MKNYHTRSLVLILSVFYLSTGLFGCRRPEKKDIHANAIDTTSLNEAYRDSAGTDVAFDDFDSMVRQYEDPERKNWQSPELVLQKMGDLTGKKVADIGVGTGYFAFRLIQRGADVIGIDIDKRFLDYINERKAELSQDMASRLETRLSKPETPALNKNEVDWILIVNTYHFLEHRVGYLKKLYSDLKTGGKIMIVDFKKGYTPVGPAENEKVLPDVAGNELSAAGFSIIDTDENTLQYQYIITAVKP